MRNKDYFTCYLFILSKSDKISDREELIKLEVERHIDMEFQFDFM